jgi:hypothetical protein
MSIAANDQAEVPSFSRHAAIRYLPMSAAVTVLAFTTLLAIRAKWSVSIGRYDEGIVLSFSDLWTRGYVPNRDFFSNYPPGNYWIVGTAFRIFGHTVGVERAVGALYRIVLVGCIFALSRPRGNLVALGGAMFALVACMAGWFAAFSWYGSIAFCLLSLCLLAASDSLRHAKSRLILVAVAGAAAAGAALLRTDTPGIGILVASAPLLFWLPRREKLAYAIAWCVLMLPLLVHGIRVGPGRFIENVYTSTIFHIGPARRLPIPPPQRYGTVVLLVLVTFIAVNFCASIWNLTRSRNKQDWVYLSISLLTICCLPQALARADPPHFMYVGVLAFGFAPASFSLLFRSRSEAAGNWLVQIASASVTANLLLFARSFAPSAAPAPTGAVTPIPSGGDSTVQHDGRRVRLESAQEAQNVMQVFALVDELTRPGDRLFVGTADLRIADLNDLYLYFMFPRLAPAGYHLQTDPGYTNAAGSTLPNEVARADVLILNSDPLLLQEPQAGKFGSDEPNQVVASRFSLVRAIGTYHVYTQNVK